MKIYKYLISGAMILKPAISTACSFSKHTDSTYKKLTADQKSVVIMNPRKPNYISSGLYKLNPQGKAGERIYDINWNDDIHYLSDDGKLIIKEDNRANGLGALIYLNGKLVQEVSTSFPSLYPRRIVHCGRPYELLRDIEVKNSGEIVLKLRDTTTHIISPKSGKLISSNVSGLLFKNHGNGYSSRKLPFTEYRIFTHHGYYIATAPKIEILKPQSEDLILTNTYDSNLSTTYGTPFERYEKINNSIYYSGKELTKVDTKSFRLSQNIESQQLIAYDKNGIYERGEKITFKLNQIQDPSSLAKIGEHTYKDDNNVYYKSKILIGADSKTFIQMNNEYAKDLNSVYLDGIKIQALDSATFEIIDHTYSKDKNRVYRNKKQLPSYIDSASFKIIQNSFYTDDFTKDKNRVYYKGNKFSTIVDKKTFEVLSHKHSKDERHVFYEDKLIKEASASDFKIIGNRNNKVIYSQSGQKLFFKEKKIIQIDASSFEIIDSQISKDQNYIYLNGHKVNNSHAPTFKLTRDTKTYASDKNLLYLKKYNNSVMIKPQGFEQLRFGYTKTKKNVFFKKKIITNADPTSFKVLSKRYAKDNNSIYSRGIPEKWGDPKTFTHVSHDTYADKSAIYKGRKKLKGINPKGYSIINNSYSRNHKYLFFNNRIVNGISPKKLKYIGLSNNNGGLIQADNILIFYGLPFKEMPVPKMKQLSRIGSETLTNSIFSSAPIKSRKNGVYCEFIEARLHREITSTKSPESKWAMNLRGNKLRNFCYSKFWGNFLLGKKEECSQTSWKKLIITTYTVKDGKATLINPTKEIYHCKNDYKKSQL